MGRGTSPLWRGTLPNYLTTPYLFTYPGVQTREVEPWDEDGQTWRRLHVTFPDTIATHTAEQDFYYDSDAMLRRHDYTVDVNANAVSPIQNPAR